MIVNSKVLPGACYCGKIAYQVTGEFSSVCCCHCQSCRLASGAPYVAWATTARGAFEVIRGKLSEISLSPGIRRGFCQHCGTSLTYWHEQHPDEIDICLVTLENATAIQPEDHIWVADKLPWVRLADGLPQHQEWRDTSA